MAKPGKVMKRTSAVEVSIHAVSPRSIAISDDDLAGDEERSERAESATFGPWR